MKRPGLKAQIEDAGNKIKYKDLPKIDIAQFFDLEYYVPSIEEFHPGFKYEHLSDGLFEDSIEDFWGWYNRCFGEDSFDIDIVIEEFKKESERFRVKYLDKEDIKELGITINEWFISKGDIGGTYKITATGLEYNSIIYIHSKDFIRNGSGDYTTSVMRFKIKNISELKIILKQIGISNAK